MKTVCFRYLNAGGALCYTQCYQICGRTANCAPVPLSPRLAPWRMHKSYTSRLKIWVKERTEEIQLKFPHSALPEHLHTDPAALLFELWISLKGSNQGKGRGEASFPPLPANFRTAVLMQIHLLLIRRGSWARSGGVSHGPGVFGGGLTGTPVPSALTASAMVRPHFPGGAADWGKENTGFVGWRCSQAAGEVKWKY